MSDHKNNPWIVTVSKDGFITIAMSPDQAQEIIYRADEANQPLPLYLKHCLCMSDEPMPELVEIHKAPGTYPSFLDLCAKLGFRDVLLKFSKYPTSEGHTEKIVLCATVDEANGLTATIAVKDLPLWKTIEHGARARKAPPTKKRRKKQTPAQYQFSDTDAGHA